jgi:CRISPR-associated protein Cas1
MIKRSLIIASRSTLSTRNEQLLLRLLDSDEEYSIPIEDIGYIEISTTQCTISTAAITRLSEHQVSILMCGQSQLPVALTIPYAGNTLHNERLRLQIEASKPTLKRIWQSLIKAKIRNQADVLARAGHRDATLRRYEREVLTDDSSNREGAAAQHYWKLMLKPFDVTRDPDGPFPNNFLNYGYAVVRSSVARGLVAAGLHPAIGVRHKNRYNAFALADDVIEPFRPFVDQHLLPYCLGQDEWSLTPEHKKFIVSVLTVDAHHSDLRRPLMNSIELTCARVVQALRGDIKALDLPRPVG